MNKKEKCSVKKKVMNVLNENKGFTLLEMILSLSIFCIIAALVPLIIQNVGIFKAFATDQNNINYELCIRDILSEIDGETLYIENQQLHFKGSDDKIYSYGFHNGRIVRKVNQMGYTILMESVIHIEFIEHNGIWMKIKFKGDRSIRDEMVQLQ